MSQRTVDDGTANREEDEDDEVMNVKGSWVESIASALIVGVIVAAASRWGTRSDDTRDQVMALRAQVGEIAKQLDRLSTVPYVRQEDFSRAEARITGLERRVGDIERQRQ